VDPVLTPPPIPIRPPYVAPAQRADSGSLFSGAPLAGRDRLVVALLIAAGAGLTTWLSLSAQPVTAAKDFTYPWRAARALLAGLNPYAVIVPSGHYPFESRLPYPLPAALVAVPVAGLPAVAGAALFVSVSCGLLAWAWGRDGMWRFWAFCSAPLVMTLAVGQWSPLLIAGALLPALGFALAFKPTIGLALFVWRPSWRVVVAGLSVCALCLALVPTWPVDWVQAARQTVGHPPPIARPLGWLPLLAVARWRLPEARLVAVMACMPQNPYFYDQLALWLVAWNGRTALLLTLLSWVAYIGTKANCTDVYFCGAEAEPWVQWLLYVPATALALARDVQRPWLTWLGRAPGAQTPPDQIGS
jgi:hypothetical protein